MVTVKNDAHRKHTAAKNHGVLFVENRVVADFRSNREALFEEEVDIIFGCFFFSSSLNGDFCDLCVSCFITKTEILLKEVFPDLYSFPPNVNFFYKYS